MPKKDDDRFSELNMWKYWKRTLLEDCDELRNHIVDIRLEQARIAVEQQELEYRMDRIEKIMGAVIGGLESKKQLEEKQEGEEDA